jgi:hypothetical protein
LARIKRREERKGALEAAKGVMEERYAEARREREAAKEANREMKESGAEKEEGKAGETGTKEGKSGKGVSAGREKPLEEYQYNFTDPESRIMLTGQKEFEQCYNAQAAVDVDTML